MRTGLAPRACARAGNATRQQDVSGHLSTIGRRKCPSRRGRVLMASRDLLRRSAGKKAVALTVPLVMGAAALGAVTVAGAGAASADSVSATQVTPTASPATGNSPRTGTGATPAASATASHGTATATPTPAATHIPTATGTPTTPGTHAGTPTVAYTAAPTPTPSGTHTATPAPTGTHTATPAPTGTHTATPAPTAPHRDPGAHRHAHRDPGAHVLADTDARGDAGTHADPHAYGDPDPCGHFAAGAQQASFHAVHHEKPVAAGAAPGAGIAADPAVGSGRPARGCVLAADPRPAVDPGRLCPSGSPSRGGGGPRAYR